MVANDIADLASLGLQARRAFKNTVANLKFNNIVSLLKDILTGNDGSYALVKVIAFLVILTILGEHFYMVVHTGQTIPLDWEQITAILASLTAGVAHAVQDDPAPPAAPPGLAKNP